MLTLANAFASRGLEVDLVLAGATGEYLSEISPEVRLVDLRSRRVITSLPALVRYIRRERPAVLLSAMSHANVVAVWARALAGRCTRLLVSQHNDISQSIKLRNDLRVRTMTRMMRSAYARADAVIAVSRGVADALARAINYPLGRIKVIFNPVDLARIQRQARVDIDHPWLHPDEPPVIISVGRLVPEKDFGTLLRAFEVLRKTRSARLVILGEGRLRADLLRLASELGIEGDVSMPGFVGNPFSYMARANVFVLSSRTEGLPTALIEALACGCPVVSTDCPSGPSEILEGGKWGRLVPVGDADALAHAIAATLSETDHRDVTARAREFGLDVVVDDYFRVLFPVGRAASKQLMAPPESEVSPRPSRPE